jgi:hypothetical protein
MFGAYFAFPMGLFFAWQISMIGARPFHESFGMGMLLGLAAGAMFGAVMARFMRGVTCIVGVPEPKAFIQNINIAAAQLGYRPSFATEQQFCFRPTWQAGLLAGQILVQLRDHEAVVVGPRIYVGRFVKRLADAT